MSEEESVVPEVVVSEKKTWAQIIKDYVTEGKITQEQADAFRDRFASLKTEVAKRRAKAKALRKVQRRSRRINRLHGHKGMRATGRL